ncbi:MAG: lamin tail domain-containing protein [Bacteroidetes bacterium]|nr:lamin tail domain-containing protein [Bacteroidota bacterium]
MKEQIIFLFTLLFSSLLGNSQVQDSFSDGNFTSNPTWSGSSSQYLVNGMQELQLNDVLAGQAFLSTPNSTAPLSNCEWRIKVRQSFAGSDNNHSRIYLMHSNGDLSFINATSGTQGFGYFLKLGEAGSTDAIKLYRDDGAAGVVEIAAGSSGLIAGAFEIRIQVLRDAMGIWEVYVDPSGGVNFTPEINVSDNTYNTTSHLGVSCLYTASNATKFYFDDIYCGAPIPPPIINVPNERSVVINEIYPDPSPSNGLPDAEYIELFNADTVVYDLAGWKLVNSNTEKVLPSYQLNPQAYVILCDAANAVYFTQSIGISAFTALTNTGDSLTLKYADNSVIDQVTYTTSWYNDTNKEDGGWSLELINPTLSCSSSYNWTASSNAQGGTPGQVNSVLNLTPDTTSPMLISKSLINSTTVSLLFNESVSGVDPILWSCVSLDIVSAYSNPSNSNEIWITFNTPIQQETLYILSHPAIVDCEGNTNSFQTELFIGKTPELGDIVFSEILADPDPTLPGGIPAEYVEIWNISEHTLELQGLRFNNATIDFQFLLAPNAYITLGDADNALAFLSLSDKILLDNFPTLTNSGMFIELAIDTLILDSLTYSINWYAESSKQDGGWSLELINPYLPCFNPSNWGASLAFSGGTPNSNNSIYSNSPDSTSPQLQYFTFHNNVLTCFFNEFVSNSSNSLQSSIAYTTNLTIDDSTLYQLSDTVYDCSGNSLVFTVDFGNGFTPLPGHLVINEVLFNPFELGSDFVEIVNTTNHCIDLFNCSLANDDASNNDIISHAHRILLPHQYIVFTEDGNDLIAYYPSTQEENIFKLEALPSMNNDAGTIQFLNASGVRIDGLNYNEEMHFDLLNSFDGVSLERINFNAESDNETSWQSASYLIGFATPGTLNSQYISVENSDSQFSLNTEIFSPDNDGYDDVLGIIYSDFPASSVGNITIYNERGIRVRRLMRNEYIGTQGTLFWDGLSDDSTALSIGIYHIIFEVFQSNGEKIEKKTTCVLAKK